MVVTPECGYEGLATMVVVALVAVPVATGLLLPVAVNVTVTATLLVYVGSARALAMRREASESGGKKDARCEDAVTVTTAEAAQLPFVGSVALLGLWVAIKVLGKDLLNLLMLAYFSVLGAFAVESMLEHEVWPAVLRGPGRRAADCGPPLDAVVHLPKPLAACWGEKTVDLRLTGAQCGLWALAAGLTALYVATRHWALNNLLGASFCISGIQYVSLGSYRNAAILLAGLFIYDVTWVFGTTVMVDVAKGINGPIKLLFPRPAATNAPSFAPAVSFAPALDDEGVPQFSLLGLGDIVVPGLFLALLLRFDAKKKLPSMPYFSATLLAYALGLALTLFVMFAFNAAQPALLYLVPATLGASLVTAAVRSEVGELLRHDEDAEKKGEATDGAAANQQKSDGDDEKTKVS